MSISSQRAALRKSAINLDRIRSSLRTFGRGITSAKIQTDEILKQTRERNNFKSTLINQDEKKIKIDWNDEIINSVILSHEGDIKLENFK